MINSATLTDVPEIRALMKSIPGFWSDSWRPDVLERALEARETHAFVERHEGQLRGFVCDHDVAFRAYLTVLAVAPSEQRRGIGASLLRHLEAHLAAIGCSILIADVWHEAEAFYRAHGWSPPPVVLLRKQLREATV
jgi:ribosomal protein S18 acetylase RimI-like enzyme